MLLKDDLFKLVKAMSKSEKRYFSLDAQKSGKKGSRYLEVFRFLSDMDEFNDERLKKKFPKNLSSDKSYLYDAILRSMRDYRSTKSKAAQIKEKIQDSRYLFERGLYKQCDSRLQEANDIATELGDELMILEVARERLLTIKSNKEKNFVEYVESLLEDKEKALANVNQFFKYSDAYYEMTMKVAKNFQSPIENKESIVLPDFFEEEKNDVKSIQTERRFLQSKALYYQLKGDKKKLLEYFKKTVEWWKKNPLYKEEEFFRYVADTSNLIYGYIANQKFEEAELCINEMFENQPALIHEKRVWLENIYLYKLVLLLNSMDYSKDYRKAKDLVMEIEKVVNEYGFTNNHVLFGNVSLLYFLIGDYHKCQNWSAKIIDAPNTGLRADIQVFVRILNLICLYETEELELLENGIRNVKRFFKRHEIALDSLESQIFQKLTILFKSNPYTDQSIKDDFIVFLSEKEKTKNSRNDLVGILLMWLSPITTAS